ncbi:uncharacterized protein Fot_43969 [Forsythia ovata]|uniref:Uncharacterized protein n=1 Tax=Forsythia ovata TaxID=205694 RepID=A0ABD1R256_9LAMI
MRANKKGGDRDKTSLELAVPVMNMRRRNMWKQQQAAWLFHHVGLDATALLFANEVDLETLIMEKQLSMLVVGEDILRTNGEVGSGCTIVTDNYCEDAYDLLQTPIVKKLLLAGILLDTQNLNVSTKLSMARDAEAVQLLSVGSVPNYRNALFDQLMQDQRDNDFLEVLRHSYGKPSGESNWDSGASIEKRISEKYPFSEGTAPRGNNQNNAKDETNRKAVAWLRVPTGVVAKASLHRQLSSTCIILETSYWAIRPMQLSHSTFQAYKNEQKSDTPHVLNPSADQPELPICGDNGVDVNNNTSGDD